MEPAPSALAPSAFAGAALVAALSAFAPLSFVDTAVEVALSALAGAVVEAASSAFAGARATTRQSRLASRSAWRETTLFLADDVFIVRPFRSHALRSAPTALKARAPSLKLSLFGMNSRRVSTRMGVLTFPRFAPIITCRPQRSRRSKMSEVIAMPKGLWSVILLGAFALFIGASVLGWALG